MEPIEEFLGLDKNKIEERMSELESRLPTRPGIEYLKTRMNSFDIQPWPFIIYLSYYNPKLLERGLSSYTGYDGGETINVLWSNFVSIISLGNL